MVGLDIQNSSPVQQYRQSIEQPAQSSTSNSIASQDHNLDSPHIQRGSVATVSEGCLWTACENPLSVDNSLSFQIHRHLSLLTCFDAGLKLQQLLTSDVDRECLHDMPAFTGEGINQDPVTSAASSFDHLPRKSHDKSLGGVFTLTNGIGDGPHEEQNFDHLGAPGKSQGLYTLTNGTSSNGNVHGRDRSHSKAGSIRSMSSAKARFTENERRSPTAGELAYSRSSGTDRSQAYPPNGVVQHTSRASASSLKVMTNGDAPPPVRDPSTDLTPIPTTVLSSSAPDRFSNETSDYLTVSSTNNRHSTPLPGANYQQATTVSPSTSNPPRLAHRHTLQVPRVSTSRTSREFSATTNAPSEEATSTSGRFSPTHPSARRGSLGLVRRGTRSITSDLYLEEIPQDEDAMRWTEAVRQKRASKRRRKEEEDDDRVIVGTKVDQGHVNWVTAYNMLTGIRFTVSRTNAKMDRELTDADFLAKHKFSFDV